MELVLLIYTKNKFNYNAKRLSYLLLSGILLILLAPGCNNSTTPGVVAPAQGFLVTPLAANNASYGAANVDANLQDTWGLAFSSFGTPYSYTLSDL